MFTTWVLQVSVPLEDSCAGIVNLLPSLHLVSEIIDDHLVERACLGGGQDYPLATYGNSG